jgi:ribosome-associated protein
LTSLEILKKAAEILDSKKAEDIKAIEIRGISVISDYFLLASGTSTTQVKALADELDFKLSELGVTPLRTEGAQSASWIILDYGDVIIHIFHKETREFFNLERLWADGKTIGINELVVNV